jgi:hypothetical protein
MLLGLFCFVKAYLADWVMDRPPYVVDSNRSFSKILQPSDLSLNS